MWAFTMAHPDTASSSVLMVAKFCDIPDMELWEAAVNILQFLLRTKDTGLTYEPTVDRMCKGWRWRHPVMRRHWLCRMQCQQTIGAGSGGVASRFYRL